ncbi:MAG: hypothetical protein METHAR1v1_560009 [Methanothrix sp.]|jgi:hypothetical protein|nr:MAG: hypothetical protein METHAR1v1_560009 [Methanothrix sp.]
MVVLDDLYLWLEGGYLPAGSMPEKGMIRRTATLEYGSVGGKGMVRRTAAWRSGSVAAEGEGTTLIFNL